MRTGDRQLGREMRSILKRRDDGRRSTLAQPCSTSDSAAVQEIVAEEARLSPLPWSGPPSRSPSPDAGRDSEDTGVARRLRQDVEKAERGLDADLCRVEEDLQRVERRLDSRLQQCERRLRLSADIHQPPVTYEQTVT